MAFLPLETVLREAKAGDLLEFDRKDYSHYALYLGDNKVMNILGEFKSSEFAKIEKKHVNEVANDSLVKISNHDNVAEKYFQKEARPIAEIFRAAEAQENQMVHYDAIFRNCEYYCTMWRYGKGFSTQIAEPTRTPGVLKAFGVESWQNWEWLQFYQRQVTRTLKKSLLPMFTNVINSSTNPYKHE